MSQEDAVIESFVRNRTDLGGDLCLDMGSGITMGIRVGVEGLGSLLGLGRKSATDARVFKNDKLDMAEDISATGSLHVSTGLAAARTFRFESLSGLKGRGPPILAGSCRTWMMVVEVTGVVALWPDCCKRFVYLTEFGNHVIIAPLGPLLLFERLCRHRTRYKG